jgi:hypothetical protein
MKLHPVLELSGANRMQPGPDPVKEPKTLEEKRFIKDKYM